MGPFAIGYFPVFRNNQNINNWDLNIDVNKIYDYRKFYFYNNKEYIPLDLKIANTKPDVIVRGACIFYFYNEIINGKKYLHWYFYENRGYSSNDKWPFDNVTFPIFYNIRDDFLIYESNQAVSKYKLFYFNENNEFEPFIDNSMYCSDLNFPVNRGENIYFINCEIK